MAVASWLGTEKKFGNRPLAALSLGSCSFGISVALTPVVQGMQAGC